jgi:hypothetical protein
MRLMKGQVVRRRARLGMLGVPMALALGIVTPTPLGLTAGAMILFGTAVAMWIMRCPQCGRRLGPIVAFKHCTSCGGRIA